MGELAIIIKYRLEATWRHFDNPIKFYRKIVRQQVELGMIDPSVMTSDSIKRENPFKWMIK